MLQVSWSALAALLLLLAVCFVLPLGLFGVLFKLAGGRLKTCGIGAGAYFLGGFVVEMLLLASIGALTDMTRNVPVYLLYSLLVSPAIFMAVNFFVMRKFAEKDLNSTGDAMMYSVGYSGLQNLLTTGFVALMYFVTLWSIKSHGGGYVVVSESDYVSYSNLVSSSNLVTDTIYEQMQELCSRPASYFLTLCLDRLWVIAVYAALLLVVWLAVKKTNKLPILGIAYGMRLLVGLPTVLSDLHVISNPWISAAMVVLISVVEWVAAIFCWKRHIDEN